MGGVFVPFGLALLIITGRSLTSSQGRVPRPYELSSAGVIYGLAALVGDANEGLGATIAWGYLVAILLRPNSAQLLQDITGGIKSPPGTAGASQTTPQPVQPQ